MNAVVSPSLGDLLQQNVDRITNADDPLSTSQRMRAMCEIESEQETPIDMMTEAELMAVIAHDPDKDCRRKAARVLRARAYAEGIRYGIEFERTQP